MGKKQTLIKILIFGMLLTVSLLLGSVASVRAQGVSPTATGTPDVVSTLQVVVLTQQALTHTQEMKLSDLTFDVTKNLWYVSTFFGSIAVLIAFFGWKTYKDIDQQVQTKIKTSIDKEFEKQFSVADLRMIPVRVREGRNLEQVLERLKLYGLKNLTTYLFFSKDFTTGITVVPIENERDEEEFLTFLETYQVELSPEKVAFILYTGKYRVSPNVMNSFPNLLTANLPSTTGIAVINIGKTLRNKWNVEDK